MILLPYGQSISVFSGLKLTLNIEVDDYITALADSAGIRLLIHNPYNMPFVEDEGLSLSPGRANLIGVRKVSITLKLYSRAKTGRLVTPIYCK